MAFISQDQKKELAPGIKNVLKKYNVKGSISVRHYSELCVTLREGALDLLGIYEAPTDYAQVNVYHVVRHTEDEYPTISNFYRELIEAMKGPKWFDKSDSQTDYFHTAWYLSIDVGKYNKPYIYTGGEA